MNYPESLKKGDTIGICAPSGGITKIDKIKKLEEAIKQLEEMGYNVIETESVRKEEKGRSNTAKKRAEEFMQLLKNDSVKLIIFATGGDYLMEMLDYLNIDEIKKLKPKWMQGFSDITTLEFLLSFFDLFIISYSLNLINDSVVSSNDSKSDKFISYSASLVSNIKYPSASSPIILKPKFCIYCSRL